MRGETGSLQGVEADARTVIVVDDDVDLQALLQRWLAQAGYAVRCCESGEALGAMLRETLPVAVCLDLGLPGAHGLEILPLLRARHRDVPVIVLTADASAQSAVQAMKAGALDYVTKPAKREQIVEAVERAVSQYQSLHSEGQELPGLEGLVGKSAPMQALFRQIRKVAASDITVFIHGESGTGKELVAQSLHALSARSHAPLVPVNCAAIPETMQDAELFGYEKGAFTGAIRAKAGRFEQADGGTLFLDEVAELVLPLQAKLLRVVQERSFERLGSERVTRADFRMISATHQSLKDRVEAGAFREDLFFRLAVMELEVPALRERPGDIDCLARDWFAKRRAQTEEGPRALAPAALQALSTYAWPGNVRELFNVLERASVLSEGDEIALEDLPPRLRPQVASLPAPQTPEAAGSALQEPPEMSLEDLERWAIEATLRRTDGNVSEAVRRLGIGRTTLYRKLKHYAIES